MSKKLKVGILGTGNIGTDLLYKVLKSDELELTLFMGHREESKGIAIARSLGLPATTDSIQALVQNPEACDLVFDATSAKLHLKHAKILHELGKKAIDLTPACVGKMCVPAVNGDECIEYENINMVTCGGQATIPLIKKVCEVQQGVKYVEVVASIASLSAGTGTRNNIDEFTQTTKRAIEELGGALRGKAIITLNPAQPPVQMHNTIFMLIDHCDMDKVRMAVDTAVAEVQKYVPGYMLALAPTEEKNRITMMVQVKGAGDYLPSYAGNLDIITCAAVEMAKRWKRRIYGN